MKRFIVVVLMFILLLSNMTILPALATENSLPTSISEGPKVCEHETAYASLSTDCYLVVDSQKHVRKDYYITYCDECEIGTNMMTVVETESEHEMDSLTNKCSKCNYSEKAASCEHDLVGIDTSLSYRMYHTYDEKYNDIYPSHTVWEQYGTMCHSCGIILEDEFICYHEEHQLDGEGVCEKCGYNNVANTCTHAREIWTESRTYEQKDEETHYEVISNTINCAECGFEFAKNIQINKYHKYHNVVNGKCDCGYGEGQGCEHELKHQGLQIQCYAYYDGPNNTSTIHNVIENAISICQKCFTPITGESNSYYEAHDYDSSGVCKKCNYSDANPTCGHLTSQSNPAVVSYEQYDNDSHYKVETSSYNCADCGILSATVSVNKTLQKHTYTGSENKCVCGALEDSETALPTLENFTLNGQTDNATVAVGEQLTLGGTVKGNGNNLAAVSVAIRNASDETLGGEWHTGRDTEGNAINQNMDTFELSEFNDTIIIAGNSFGNTTLAAGQYIVQAYATNQDGEGFADAHIIDLTITEEGACQHNGTYSDYDIDSDMGKQYALLWTGIQPTHQYPSYDEDGHNIQRAYYRVCDLCHMPYAISYGVSAYVAHAFDDGACECGYTCTHDYQICYDETGNPVYVRNSGKWVKVDETYCKKLVRYWEECAHCGLKRKGTTEYEDGSVSEHLIGTVLSFAPLAETDPDYATMHLETTTYQPCLNCGYDPQKEPTTERREHTLSEGECEACGYKQKKAQLWDFNTDSYSFVNSYSYFGEEGLPRYIKQEHMDEWLLRLTKSDAINDIHNIAMGYARKSWTDNLKSEDEMGTTMVKRLRECDLKEWDGACYGIALTQGLFKTGALSPEVFGANTTRSLPALNAEENNDLESFINLFSMTQDLSYMYKRNYGNTRGTEEFSTFMQTTLKYASDERMKSNENVFLINMRGPGGHTILCYGLESGNWTIDNREYHYRLTCADPNYINDPTYIYVTESLDFAKYQYSDYTKFGYHGYGETDGSVVKLDADLLEQLKIPYVFLPDEENDVSTLANSDVPESESNESVILNIYDNCPVVILSDSESATLSDGEVMTDSLGIRLGYYANAVVGENAQNEGPDYLLLPYDSEYTIMPDENGSSDLAINFGKKTFRVAGSFEQFTANENGLVNVKNAQGKMIFDIVNSESDFDFLSIACKADGDVDIKAEEKQVIMKGSIEDYDISHLDRSWNMTEAYVDDISDFAIKLLGGGIAIFVDTDGDGIYETEISMLSVPKTGDDTNLALLFVLMLLSTVSLAAIIVNGKRNRGSGSTRSAE